MSPDNRKFLTEALYGVTVYVDYISRPQQLSELQSVTYERPPHLYLITRLPLMKLNTETAAINEEFIEGSIKIQHEDTFTEYPFHAPHPFGADRQIVSHWPYDEFVVHDSEGQEIGGGTVANLGLMSTINVPVAAMDYEVLYVGQAYGENGERIAPHRLSSHETLQKALAENPHDKQIWLMVASVSDENFFLEIDPRPLASKSNDEDNDHIRELLDAIDDPPFDESIAVSIAEAGLIRYFQPQYNKIFKNTFPTSNQKMLETLRELDLLGIVVELQSHGIPVLLSSNRVKPHVYHEAKYYIHLDGENRVSDWAMRDWLTPRKISAPRLDPLHTSRLTGECNHVCLHCNRSCHTGGL
ncbi:hypothetical protein ACXPWS_11550 [Mycobacterium sp. BMJ-28]